MNHTILVLFLLICTSTVLIFCQLVVNVRNKGGETIVEKILSNVTEDTVILEFLGSDGMFVTQFIDFKSEMQIFRMYVPGEEELGQSQPQALCFITRFMRSDLISSDAMSKLRQKNPTAVRTPEEEKEMVTYTLDLTVNIEKADLITPYTFNICSEAKDSSYTQEVDLKTISKSLAKDYVSLISATSELPPYKFPRCRELPIVSKPCTCELRTCIGWYPCGLKYCHGTDSSGKVVSYRCGIKTCKRCVAFVYVVNSKFRCLWDS
ncbi:out at first protein [Biomphalaria pfeifferi]|uniref:Out at first protein n=1 Tax=Biomphalaria pfeifferi TaxID=112525 RepID=A0AAD8EX71_BIOPF|nr:out at first protein [Biomphalaria pfeifferi]